MATRLLSRDMRDGFVQSVRAEYEEVRSRYRELPPDRTLLIFCNAGTRSFEVQVFLDAQDKFVAMYEDICGFLARWIPHYQEANRGYMTVAIGCTGGQHRSVYVVDKLAGYFRDHHHNVTLRHTELPG